MKFPFLRTNRSSIRVERTFLFAYLGCNRSRKSIHWHTGGCKSAADYFCSRMSWGMPIRTKGMLRARDSRLIVEGFHKNLIINRFHDPPEHSDGSMQLLVASSRTNPSLQKHPSTQFIVHLCGWSLMLAQVTGQAVPQVSNCSFSPMQARARVVIVPYASSKKQIDFTIPDISPELKLNE